jgi:hypothetical protein
MQVEPYVAQVQTQLAAASALGDDSTRAVAQALAAAAEPAVRLALLGAVSAAANEITAALLDSPGSPAVSVRIEGDEVQVDVRHSSPADFRGDAGDDPGDPDGNSPDTNSPDTNNPDTNNARISLRLPEGLKGEIEAAARGRGVSVNTWILRAVSGALAGSRGFSKWQGTAPRRITGWING